MDQLRLGYAGSDRRSGTLGNNVLQLPDKT
jgi:hypothetical protein